MKKTNIFWGFLLVVLTVCWGMDAGAVNFKAVDNEGHVKNLKEKFDDSATNGTAGKMKIYK